MILAGWSGLVVVGEGMILYALAAGWPKHGSIWFLVAIPLIMLLLVYALLRLSGWLARVDTGFLLTFLQGVVRGTVDKDS